MKEQYQALGNIVNTNLRKNGLEEISFERFEGIGYDILALPKSYLLQIEDNKVFLHEAYYKILDRDIDKNAFDNLYQQLESGKVNKVTILNSLFNSKEREVKKTKLVG